MSTGGLQTDIHPTSHPDTWKRGSAYYSIGCKTVLYGANLGVQLSSQVSMEMLSLKKHVKNTCFRVEINSSGLLKCPDNQDCTVLR